MIMSMIMFIIHQNFPIEKGYIEALLHLIRNNQSKGLFSNGAGGTQMRKHSVFNLTPIKNLRYFVLNKLLLKFTLIHETDSIQKRPEKSGLFCMYERVTGIEPVSLPWQGNIIATIRYPLSCEICRLRKK